MEKEVKVLLQCRHTGHAAVEHFWWDANFLPFPQNVDVVSQPASALVLALKGQHKMQQNLPFLKVTPNPNSASSKNGYVICVYRLHFNFLRLPSVKQGI